MHYTKRERMQMITKELFQYSFVVETFSTDEEFKSPLFGLTLHLNSNTECYVLKLCRFTVLNSINVNVKSITTKCNLLGNSIQSIDCPTLTVKT